MNEKSLKKNHLLTVLVEDYFHVGAFENLIQQRNWANFEPRYEQNTLKTLDLLDEFKTKATFFVLGWIAEQNPKLIKEIVSRGHEVASRGFYHRSLRHLTPEEFREDLRKTNHALEDAGGKKIIGYRSAEKLNYEKDSWIFDVLAEENFVYDASFLAFEKRRKAKTADSSGSYEQQNRLGISIFDTRFRFRTFPDFRRQLFPANSAYANASRRAKLARAKRRTVCFVLSRLGTRPRTAAHFRRFALQPRSSLSQIGQNGMGFEGISQTLRFCRRWRISGCFVRTICDNR